MTPLLPALGYDPIYRQIDLQQPYDAPANLPAMQQTIPEFTLPRRKPSRSPRGLSLTHFAGVGGQDVREPTGLVHLGLFSDGGPVKRDQFTDGLVAAEPVGRKLDFLLQELNREVNTIGSKTVDSAISARVVDLKSVLERMREQAANVE